MAITLLILSYVAKGAGFLVSRNAVPFVSPAIGVIIFFGASLLKDTVDRIGDFLDNGKPDWRDQASYRPRAGIVRGLSLT